MGNLNENLQPINSPIAQNQGAVSAYDFFAQHDRSSIMLSKIRNFSFNQAIGGTLILGGTANGNGVILIKDAAGNIIVQGDSNGLTIYDGNLLVKNDNNTTIIDTAGIVSSANFPNASAFNGTANLTTTSTSFTDVPGSNAGTLITDRTINVLFAIMGYGHNNGVITSEGSDLMEMQVYDSGVSAGVMNMVVPGLTTTHAFNSGSVLNITMTTNDLMIARTTILTVAAGTHSYKLQYRAIAGGTAVLDAWNLVYVSLGM